MSERVKVQIEEGIADVRLHRPEKHNALDPLMFEALHEAGTTLATNTAVRVIVLSGEGKSFCSGLDFASFTADPSTDLFARKGIANLAQQAAWTWVEQPAPVIAALTGHCYGGGFQIALGADIRFAAPDTRLSLMEVKWGLVADMAGTQLLPRIIGLDHAKELAFTGRVLSGEEALQIGLVTHLAQDPHEAAFMLAQELAKKSPDALAGAKQLFNATGSVSLAEGLRLEEQVQRAMFTTQNQSEALQANFERRKPVFANRSYIPQDLHTPELPGKATTPHAEN